MVFYNCLWCCKMHLTNICWLKGCNWITVLWWQILTVENSPCSCFPSSLGGGTTRKALAKQRTWCYESTGNIQATIFWHLNKHRVFRKNNKECEDPAFTSRQEENTVLEFGSLVSPCPQPPSLLGAEGLWQSDVTRSGKGSPGSQGLLPAKPGQSQPPPARRGEKAFPGQRQVLNSVMDEASKRGFNDSWHSSWMHKQPFAGH